MRGFWQDLRTPAWVDVFALDLRSLALFRTALGVLLLLDLVFKVPYLQAFYTDDGVLPLSHYVAAQRYLGQFSLHAISPSLLWQWVLVCVQAFAGVGLIAGYCVRSSLCAGWFLVVSAMARLPYSNDTGDRVFAIFLMLGLLLPLERAPSVLRLEQWRRADQVVRGLPSAAFILQFCLIYVSTALFKSEFDTWTEDFSALYWALSSEAMRHFAGEILYPHDRLLQVLTVVTLVVEAAAPLLILLPLSPRRQWFRVLGLGLVIGLHVAISTTMSFGIFQWVMIAGALALVPGGFWTLVLQSGDEERMLAQTGALTTDPSRKRTQRIRAMVASVFIVFMLTWGVALHQRWQRPLWFTLIGHSLYIQQNWAMYADIPKQRRWVTFRAETEDGQLIDAWRSLVEDEPIPHADRPSELGDLYPNAKWWRYVQQLAFEANDGATRRQLFANYLCKANSEKGRPLRSITVIKHWEILGLDYDITSQGKKRALADVDCRAARIRSE